MLCPIDNHELLMTVREGIEIDYCPKCRGIWLDRGELEKLIERSTRYETTPAPRTTPDAETYKRKNDDVYPEARQRYDDDDDYYREDDPRYRGKKKRGFLGDLFDIFD